MQHNPDAPSDPLIDVCLAKITVGLLPFISIASVWQRRRPVVTNLEAYRRRLKIDTSLCRTALLGDLAMRFRVIPKRSYFFGHSWKDVSRTLVLTIEQDSDPYAIMVPIIEIIRFYYAPSTQLAQALFWGEYDKTFDGAEWQ